MDKEKIRKYFNERVRAGGFGKQTQYYHQCVNYLVASRIPSGSRVFEVGIGAFPVVGKLQTARGVGIDLSEEAVKNARIKYPQHEFSVMDVDDIQLDEKFDYIIVSDVVGFLPDIQ